MSRSSQLCTLVGNIGRPLELRFTNGGRAVASGGLAVSESYKDRDGKWQEKTSWINIVLWGELAENAAQSLDAPGTRVIVTGKFETRKYEKDGTERSVTDFKVDEIGPSLQWATAQITKVSREKVDRRQADGGGVDEDSYYPGGEEPF